MNKKCQLLNDRRSNIKKRTTFRRTNGASPSARTNKVAAARNPNWTRAFLYALQLEQERGHDDGALLGGLDGFISRWQVEGKADKSLGILSRQGLVPANYRMLSVEGRSHWIGLVTEAIHSTTAEADQSTTKPRKRIAAEKPPPSSGPLGGDEDLTSLRAVSKRMAPLLKKMKTERVKDLVYLFPRRHNIVRTIREVQPDEEQTLVATVWEARATRLGRNMRGSEAVVGDPSGNLRIVWFNNQIPARQLKPGNRYIFSGRIAHFRGNLCMESPDFEEIAPATEIDSLAHVGRLFPVYPLTEGLYQANLRRAVREALIRAADEMPETLPSDIRDRQTLLELPRALWQIHYPKTLEHYDTARRRLAFEELFHIQLRVLAYRKSTEIGVPSPDLSAPAGVLTTFLSALPFELTDAQRRVLNEVLKDMSGGGNPMNRLLQGEVGSGKTVVALAALLIATACRYQGAIMVPTEVLAEQHFLTVQRLLESLMWPQTKEHILTIYLGSIPEPINIALLTGSTTASRKSEIQRMLQDGSIDIVIGTHAVIQDGVKIPNLGLAVVDEQHRFGVLQRAELRNRSNQPHILVMSATPIPRTLALTLYGDLDLSTIDALPQGRQPVRTRVVMPGRRPAVYDFIRMQVREGRQVFIIYPLIDESEAINARAAISEQKRLSEEVFSDFRIDLLHGRMNMREKQSVMDAFRRGDTDILVSTPVVEVGIDVPNAAVMLIEGADRFGLSQLHQFRGRVGRGPHPSYCILIAETPSQDAKQRMEAMETINDGFQLAEEDLRLRGPGDYFGTRQSGLPDLRMARLSDTDLLVLAREEAILLFEHDPQLMAPEHATLRKLLSVSSTSVSGEMA